MSWVSGQIFLFARGDALHRELRMIGRDSLILVKPGPFFKRLGAQIYQIHPDRPEDYKTLFDSIEPLGAGIDIVHLWNLECEGVDYIYGDLTGTLRSLRQNLVTGPRSVGRIGHALAQLSGRREVRVIYGHHGGEAHPQPQNDISPDLNNGAVLRRLRFRERPTDMAVLAPVIDRELSCAGASDLLDVNSSGAVVRMADEARCANGLMGFQALSIRPGGSYWVTDNSKGWGTTIAEYLKRVHECDVTLVGADSGDPPAALKGGTKIPNGVVHCLEEDDLGCTSHNLETTLAIDHASMAAQLDFFALLGGPRSGRYRELNFADGFVELRRKLSSLGKRYGETRSIRCDAGEPGKLLVALTMNGKPTVSGGRRTGMTSVPPATIRASQPIREQDVVKIVADTLKLQPQEVDLDASAGSRLHSMQLAEFVGRLNKRFGINLTPPLFYEHKTLRSFIRFLIDRYGAKAEAAAAPAQVTAPSPSIKTSPAVSARGLRDVAIVGISCVFPGSRDVRALWRNLANGNDLIREVPAARWDWRKYAGDSNGGLTTSRWGGFVDDIDAFDASFFGISRREAELMDPQQRLLLEAAWTAIEDAGHSPSSLSGSRTGVFIGATTHDYYELLTRSGHWDSHLGTGTSQSILANRLNFVLDICGPSETVDTACSSSLVAICRAIAAIEAGECEGALAGGVNALLSPSMFVALARAGMLCQDGRCKAFSANANGYVRGEGVGMIWLRPLEQALADGDHVYALIKGGASNHGGRVNSLTVPSPRAQADAIIRCYEKANIDPSTIGYIEAHGSGTALGDPIEINALKEAFGHLYEKWGHAAACAERSCGVGTVKSNIGHLESAAGIAGVLKVVLALQHKKLPASLHCDSVNPYIDLQGSPFYIVTKAEKWNEPAGGGPRRAGVSSFGFGGVNAHVLLEEAPLLRSRRLAAARADSEEAALVVLSAQSDDRLKACAMDLFLYLESEEAMSLDLEVGLRDLAYTLQVGRDAHAERVAFLVTSVTELRKKLSQFVNGLEGIENVYRGRVQPHDEMIGIIGRDEDMQRAVHDWLRKRKYSDLLGLWVRGLAVDWDHLYSQDKPRRVSLPTYPFARQRYWIPEADPAEPRSRVDAEGSPGGPPADLDQWFSFVEAWVPSPLEIEVESWGEKIDAKKDHAILVVSERRSHFDAMRSFCRELSRVSRHEHDLWKIGFHPLEGGDRPEQQRAEFELLLTDGDSPLTVFLFLSQDTVPGQELQELELVYTCVQSLVRRGAARPVQCYVCYRSDSSDRSIYREALSGLFKSAMLETTDHRYRSLAYPSDLVQEEDLPACLIKEWLGDETASTKPARIPMVRYDGSVRFELQVSERLAARASIPCGFREGATYLMVGGLGEVGELICLELGRCFHSRLIIFGRRRADQVGDALARIEAAGAKVAYRSVDILDAAALEREMRALKESGEVIHGVIQAARRGHDGPIARKSFREFSEVIAAKVHGTMNIERVTADEPLEFFVTFSSVASLGMRGSADYAYSSAFQNALARRRNVPDKGKTQSRRFRSLCWGQFERDGGVRPERLPARIAELNRLGIKTIDAPSSIAAMEDGLSQDVPVVGFIAIHDRAKLRDAMGFAPEPGDQARRILDEVDAFERGERGERQFAEFLKATNPEQYPDTVRKRVLEALGHSEPVRCAAEPRLSNSGREGRSVAMRIAEHLARVLKITGERVDYSKPFQDYGLDSITAMQLSSRLEKEFRIAIEPRWLIEHPCISTLAEQLGTQLTS